MSCAEPSKLGKELKQEKPFRSPAHEAVLGLLRTAAVMRHSISSALVLEGISHEQYNVLRILRGAGRGLPTLDVADRLVEPNPAITRLLDKLESKALIVRERCSRDRRKVYCDVTPKGLQVLKRLDPKLEVAGDRCVAGFTASELAQLSSFLERVRQNLIEQPN